MIVGGLGQVEFLHYLSDVGLDGPGPEDQLVRDGDVGTSLGHHRQYVALTGGEPIKVMCRPWATK